MNFFSILLEGLKGGIGSIISISIILFPLMIAMEIAKDTNLLDKISSWLRPLTKTIGISDKSAFPLAVGMIIGLTYGAGVIIQAAKDGELDKRSLILISIFLACCHAVFEDTFIFVSVGASLKLLLSIRIFTALFLTIIISRKIMIDKTVVKDEEIKLCDKHVH